MTTLNPYWLVKDLSDIQGDIIKYQVEETIVKTFHITKEEILECVKENQDLDFQTLEDVCENLSKTDIDDIDCDELNGFSFSGIILNRNRKINVIQNYLD